MTEAYIGLGGNIGDAASSIKKAYELLSSLEGVSTSILSPIYRSAPVGYENQDWFFNAVALLRVNFDCRTLLHHCLRIEQQLKRVRKEKWGPRTIDLDVIVFGDLELNEEGLIVPHPRAHERAFVLLPMKDLNPNCKIGGWTIAGLCETVKGQAIERVEV
ncbi:2-amino-4-hydroxy-6-hydroxymethyldihydropteridine diphosphokinase [Puniceicoccaceae bacterium K14]|nr:2-amino-4-hydroxy-6-hydroxymethyldihydropteridine diphosphokinase [Puniceicoccaceae bacterium K14]